MAVAVHRVLRPRRRHTGFRRILVPLFDADGAVRATSVACRLAADRGASLTIVAAVEVPQELPLDAVMDEEEERAGELLRLARAEADRYGVTAATHLVRARQTGEAFVAEAARGDFGLVVLRPAVERRPGRRRPLYGPAAAFVLKHAPCRVLLLA
jgi:nucleotide-binding universal stress UspA family protein